MPLQTFLLREIARKIDTDCTNFQPFSDSIRFVGVTFNSPTSIDTNHSYGLVDHTRPTLLRLYYALFTKDINWDAYCDLFRDFLGKSWNADIKFRKELEDLIEEHYKKKNEKLVVLFDEITKIDDLANCTVSSEMVRETVSYYCSSNIYIRACIFSVLDFKTFNTDHMLTPGANRPVISISILPKLTKDQTLELLAPAIEGLLFRQVRDGKECTLPREVYSEHLYYLTCGHPRSIDVLYHTLKTVDMFTDFISLIKLFLHSTGSSRLSTPS